MFILCGCSYISDDGYTREFLPQVDLAVHATILSSISRTTLTQTFVNPSKTKPIKEASYTFPIYDGVSVVGFVCHIGERVLRGVVKERQQAKADYQQAVDSGQSAGLLEQSIDAADVFTPKSAMSPRTARWLWKSRMWASSSRTLRATVCGLPSRILSHRVTGL